MKFEYRSLSEFMNEIMVVCPNCNSKGRVTSQYNTVWKAEFLCINCLAHRIWNGEPNSFVSAHSNYEQFNGILFGPPLDCFFRYSLWYQTACKNEVLYAYNLNHLSWLKQYVGAPLRERVQTPHGWKNNSLQSRLPHWMLSMKNRVAVIKKILELEKR